MEPDEAAIRANITRCQDGWNAGDGEAFGAPFAEDADYIIVNGMHVSGRAAIAAGHQQIFDTIYRGSHNTFTVEDIRFVRPDVAIARARARLQYHVGETTREGHARNTWVMTKDDGAWSIVAFQNTPIAQEDQGR